MPEKRSAPRSIAVAKRKGTENRRNLAHERSILIVIISKRTTGFADDLYVHLTFSHELDAARDVGHARSNKHQLSAGTNTFVSINDQCIGFVPGKIVSGVLVERRVDPDRFPVVVYAVQLPAYAVEYSLASRSVI